MNEPTQEQIQLSNWPAPRRTDLEEPSEQTMVFAWSKPAKAWEARYSVTVGRNPDIWPYWIPQPPEPGAPIKYEQWVTDKMHGDAESIRDVWNSACDILGHPEHKVKE